MKPFSFDWREPIRMVHLDCGAEWDYYFAEWPPKLVICTDCGAQLKSTGYDPATKEISFRRI